MQNGGQEMTQLDQEQDKYHWDYLVTNAGCHFGNFLVKKTTEPNHKIRGNSVQKFPQQILTPKIL